MCNLIKLIFFILLFICNSFWDKIIIEIMTLMSLRLSYSLIDHFQWALKKNQMKSSKDLMILLNEFNLSKLPNTSLSIQLQDHLRSSQFFSIQPLYHLKSLRLLAQFTKCSQCLKASCTAHEMKSSKWSKLLLKVKLVTISLEVSIHLKTITNFRCN